MRDNIAQVVACRKSGRVQQATLQKAANRGKKAPTRPAVPNKGVDKPAKKAGLVSRGKANQRKR